MAVQFGGQGLGRAFAVSPDIAKAKIAGAKLFQLFDRKPLMDSTSNVGVSPVSIFNDLYYTKHASL